MKLGITLLALLVGVCMLQAEDNTTRFVKHGFSVRPPNGWHVADTKIIQMFSMATHRGVVAHAKHRNPRIDPAVVESEILLLATKHPLGAKEDNPNITVSVEKSWNPTTHNSGTTYLGLLEERFKLFKAPSRLIGEPQKMEIVGVMFYMQDAVNNKVPDASTRQQYVTTYLDPYYLTFTISYNDKKDPDYLAMRAMIETFTTLPKNVQQGAVGQTAAPPGSK